MGTYTAPIRAMAQNAATDSRLRGNIIATRSPDRTPAEASSDASTDDHWSSWVYVSAVSPSSAATAVGRSRTDRSSIWVRVIGAPTEASDDLSDRSSSVRRSAVSSETECSETTSLKASCQRKARVSMARLSYSELAWVNSAVPRPTVSCRSNSESGLSSSATCPPGSSFTERVTCTTGCRPISRIGSCWATTSSNGSNALSMAARSVSRTRWMRSSVVSPGRSTVRKATVDTNIPTMSVVSAWRRSDTGVPTATSSVPHAIDNVSARAA